VVFSSIKHNFLSEYKMPNNRNFIQLISYTHLLFKQLDEIFAAFMIPANINMTISKQILLKGFAVAFFA